jgi:putative FmdB family regulatory protein
MPTYDYRCSACDHQFEQFQSMKDKSLRTCPKCKKPKLERLIGTGGAIIFKGSGFYQTDYRSEGYKQAASADKPADSTPADAKSSESKPAEKAQPQAAPAASKTAAASERKPEKPAKAKSDGKKK